MLGLCAAHYLAISCLNFRLMIETQPAGITLLTCAECINMYRNLFQNSVQRFSIKYKVGESIRNNRDARLLSSACVGLACRCFQGLPAFLGGRGGGGAVPTRELASGDCAVSIHEASAKLDCGRASTGSFLQYCSLHSELADCLWAHCTLLRISGQLFGSKNSENCLGLGLQKKAG